LDLDIYSTTKHIIYISTSANIKATARGLLLYLTTLLPDIYEPFLLYTISCHTNTHTGLLNATASYYY
jgi:hypothetical protein